MSWRATASDTGAKWVAERPHRVFVAVPLPPDAREACRLLIDGIRAGPYGRVPRWVHLDGLHLTVRFLGDVQPELVPDVGLAVGDALAGIQAFDVVLAGAGVFPETRKPRALWLGIERGAAELGTLARAIDEPLERLGWPRDTRPYRPHLTVARTDAAPVVDTLAVAAALAEAAGSWSVAFRAEAAILYRSHLGGGPPRYEPIVEVALDR
jgi:RNA 2',3'-cyclic 3'-phosphodiesterase